MYIIYTNACVTCKYRMQLRYLSRIARAKRSTVKTIDTRFNEAVRDQAKEVSRLPMPFVLDTETNKVVRLDNVGELG